MPKIEINNRWCKGCGICVTLCPQKVLELSMLGKAVAANPEKCVNCKMCSEHCPDYAIEVYKEE